jgi:dipeptidyl aminopeptidase/acylaminoacyl peptidase
MRSAIETDQEALWKQRYHLPITYVEQVDAPLVIIQGRHDARCPAEQIEAYAERMRDPGKDIEVLWFDAGHAGVGTEESIAQQEQLLHFA